MKILHVIVGLDRGGAEMMLRHMIETSLQTGSENSHCVISLTDLGFHGAILQKQGVPVYEIGIRSPKDFFKSALRLFFLLKKIKPDIVQTWMVHADFIGGIAARLAGIKNVIWGVHSTDYSVESRSTQALRWLCAPLSYLIPRKVVCVAQSSLNASVNAGYSAQKMIVINNGFDVETLRLQRSPVGTLRAIAAIAPDELVIGCLGRFNPAKDHANFVKAAGILAAEYPKSRFLMVGRDLDSANIELRSLISATGYVNRFILLGERSDAAACLDAMDVFVLSSCTEAFPMVLGEAMAIGIPCVATNVGDCALLLGDAGELVPARDSEALAAAVSRMLDLTSAKRRALGQKGSARVEEHFTMLAALERFDALYKSLVSVR